MLDIQVYKTQSRSVCLFVYMLDTLPRLKVEVFIYNPNYTCTWPWRQSPVLFCYLNNKTRLCPLQQHHNFSLGCISSLVDKAVESQWPLWHECLIRWVLIRGVVWKTTQDLKHVQLDFFPSTYNNIILFAELWFATASPASGESRP